MQAFAKFLGMRGMKKRKVKLSAKEEERELGRPLDESDFVDSYSFARVECPIALISGSRDTLIDHRELSRNLRPSIVVYDRIVPGWFHSDCVSAASARDILYGDLLALIKGKTVNNQEFGKYKLPDSVV